MAGLNLEQVGVVYRNGGDPLTVLEGVSLEISEGEFVCLDIKGFIDESFFRKALVELKKK